MGGYGRRGEINVTWLRRSPGNTTHPSSKITGESGFAAPYSSTATLRNNDNGRIYPDNALEIQGMPGCLAPEPSHERIAGRGPTRFAPVIMGLGACP